MKLLRLLLLLAVLPVGLWSQDAAVRYQPVQIFDWDGPVEPAMQAALSEGHLLNLNQAALEQLYQANLPAIELVIPLGDGQKVSVLLKQHDLLADDFRVSVSSFAGPYPVSLGRYYAGTVKGSSQSLAAISIFRNEVIGVLSTVEQGNMELGKLENDPKNRYALFESSKLKFAPNYECGVEDIDHPKPPEEAPLAENDPLKCVRIYFECEYDMYLANGSSVQNTINFMTGVYNVVKVLYDNDNINTTISEIFVWNTPDSYPTTSTSDALVAFRTARANNFNGNVAHLVSRGAPSGGGIAYLDVTCNKNYAFAYSYIYQSYSQFPTYSWTVMVIAHEMGHNLGSRHTHNCSWDVNGDGIASEMIDGCGPTAGYSEGSCPVAPLPTNGGTIMSYCHLIGSVGINLNNGFGPLPAARIQNRVYNGTCLTACSNCTHTISTTKIDVACNGANTGSATATPSGGTSPYTYAWSNGGNTATINNLSAGSYTVTVYDNTNCPVTASVTITQPAAINTSTSITPESSAGVSDGAINLTVSGGVAPYSFIWSNNATTEDISGIPGGTYNLTITDASNCQATRSVVVPTLSCANEVSVFPYTESFETNFGLWEQPANDDFDWTRRMGNTPTNQTGPSGAYSGAWYVYTESDGNRNSTAFLMSPCLDFSGKVNKSVTFAFHMNGSHMGTLSLQASNNNGASWSTLWSRSGSQGNSWQLQTVSLDSYSGQATRIRFVGAVGNGNRSDMAIDGIAINAEAAPCNAPVLTTSSTPVSCHGGTNGTASVGVSGGTPPFTYAWSNGAQTASVSGLAAGTYSVTVTDSDACAANASVAVSQPAALSLSFQVNNESVAGAADGAIDLSVAGGVTPYAFSWSNGANTEDLQGLGAGSYLVTVTDANNCEATGSATVEVAPDCEPIASIPYAESFETNFGLWTQSAEDDMNWTRYQGNTPTNNTGPPGAAHESYYLYTEATNNTNKTAILDGPCFDLGTTITPLFQFNYSMFGSNMGSLHCEITTNGGSSWTSLWSLSGNQGTGWSNASIDLASYVGQIVRIRFRGVTGNQQRSDMAIDHVRLDDSGGIPAGLSQPEASLFLRPNPVSDMLFLIFDSQTEGPVQARIADLSGRALKMREFQAVRGRNEWTMPVDQLPGGMYWMILEDGKSRTVEKFVVQR